MSVEAIVKGRRSIRKFKDQDVPDSLIYELFEQAAQLCDRQMLQSMRLILANRQESKERLSRYMTETFADTRIGKLMPGRMLESMFKLFAEVPGQLVVVVEDHVSSKQRDEQYAYTCFFMQTLQLLAWERGVGMFWRTDELMYTSNFFEKLGIADGERLAGILLFGFVDKTPRARNRTPAVKRWLQWPQI
jgi:nitroreductase